MANNLNTVPIVPLKEKILLAAQNNSPGIQDSLNNLNNSIITCCLAIQAIDTKLDKINLQLFSLEDRFNSNNELYRNNHKHLVKSQKENYNQITTIHQSIYNKLLEFDNSDEEE